MNATRILDKALDLALKGMGEKFPAWLKKVKKKGKKDGNPDDPGAEAGGKKGAKVRSMAALRKINKKVKLRRKRG